MLATPAKIIRKNQNFGLIRVLRRKGLGQSGKGLAEVFRREQRLGLDLGQIPPADMDGDCQRTPGEEFKERLAFWRGRMAKAKFAAKILLVAPRPGWILPVTGN
jgi:hypothetical protein